MRAVGGKSENSNGSFRIPMRGYEEDERKLKHRLRAVPNPHEGL